MKGIQIQKDSKFELLSEGLFPIAARDFMNVLVVPNLPPTLATERRFLTFAAIPVDNITVFPLAYSWVNINTGVLTSSVPDEIFGTFPPVFVSDGIRLDNTPGDQHIIIEKKGIYRITFSGKVSAAAGGFASFDADIGFKQTPPGGIVTPPIGDGAASGTLFGSLIPTSMSGTIIAQINEDNTRGDIWIKASSMTPVVPQTLHLEQNTLLAISKIGEIPQN